MRFRIHKVENRKDKSKYYTLLFFSFRPSWLHQRCCHPNLCFFHHCPKRWEWFLIIGLFVVNWWSEEFFQSKNLSGGNVLSCSCLQERLQDCLVGVKIVWRVLGLCLASRYDFCMSELGLAWFNENVCKTV